MKGKAPKDFEGITIAELLEAEEVFKVSINVLQLKHDEAATLLWKSGIKHPNNFMSTCTKTTLA